MIEVGTISRGEKRSRSTPVLSRNIAANFTSSLWTVITGPVLIAVYVRFIGIEAYGLLGIFTTLQIVFTLFDLGLSVTLNRELARLSVRADTGEEARNLVRTMEVLYWCIGGVSTLIFSALSPLLAHHWIRAQHLSPATLQQAFLIMGIILAFQFPFALYSGGLMGLQRQILLSGIKMSIGAIQGVGAVLLLWLVSPTIQMFLGWQLVVTLLQTAISALFLWRSLPDMPTKPHFQRSLLHATRRFAVGMMGITSLALLLTQADKIMLSRLLTLETFGYYTLATVISSSLYLVVAPVFAAVFPRFSQMIACNDQVALCKLYHRSCQLVSVVLLPLAVIVALFAPEILRVWTRNAAIVQNAHILVSLLVIGTTLNGLVNVPYALQLASGWTTLAFYQNAITVGLFIPLLFWAANRYGGLGAAAIWIAVNAGYVLIGIQVMHTRLMRGEKRKWYIYDVGLPLAGALIVALVGRWLFPSNASILVSVGCLMVVSLSSLLATCILTPITRNWMAECVMNYKRAEVRT